MPENFNQPESNSFNFLHQILPKVEEFSAAIKQFGESCKLCSDLLKTVPLAERGMIEPLRSELIRSFEMRKTKAEKVYEIACLIKSDLENSGDFPSSNQNGDPIRTQLDRMHIALDRLLALFEEYYESSDWKGFNDLYEHMSAFGGHIHEANQNIYAEVVYEMAKRNVAQGRWYDGLTLLEEALAIRLKAKDLKAIADTMLQIGNTHHLMSNFDTARTHFLDALRLYKHIGHQAGIAACQNGLGLWDLRLGYVDDALVELNSARDLYQTIGNTQKIAEIDEAINLANRVKERISA